MDNSIPEVQQETNQVVPQRSTQSPSNNSSFSFKRILPIAAAVVLLIAIVGGTYLLGTKKNNSKTISQVTPTVTPTPTTDPAANWKTYTNTKYGYSIKYPDDRPIYNAIAKSKDEELVGLDTTPFVMFGCSGFGIGVCNPTFTLRVNDLSQTGLKIPEIYLSQAQLDTIFHLKVGDQVDKETTYTLGGEWNQKTNYTRLTDQVNDNASFLTLDNPSGYDGSSRIWFLMKDSLLYRFECRYINPEILNTCQAVISTFKFTN